MGDFAFAHEVNSPSMSKKKPKQNTLPPSQPLPPAIVHLAAEAKRTGKSLDELASDQQKALEPKVSPEGEWFRLAPDPLNGTPYLAVHQLTIVDGKPVATRIYGPNMRDYCVGHIIDYIETSLADVLESRKAS